MIRLKNQPTPKESKTALLRGTTRVDQTCAATELYERLAQMTRGARIFVAGVALDECATKHERSGWRKAFNQWLDDCTYAEVMNGTAAANVFRWEGDYADAPLQDEPGHEQSAQPYLY